MLLACIAAYLLKSLFKTLYKVPQSKCSLRGHLPAGFCILSFSAYHTLYFQQVSCLYLVLQLIYGKAPSKSLNQVPLSIKSPMGHLSAISFILSFSAYQNMYFHKVSCFIESLPQRPGIEYPFLKIAQRGICYISSASYLFQRIKLCIFTKFHGAFRQHV